MAALVVDGILPWLFAALRSGDPETLAPIGSGYCLLFVRISALAMDAGCPHQQLEQRRFNPAMDII